MKRIPYKRQLDKSGAFNSPIVTEIAEFTRFYPAEEYHRDCHTRNPQQSYCAYVIRLKMRKFHQAFGDLVDPEKLSAARSAR